MVRTSRKVKARVLRGLSARPRRVSGSEQHDVLGREAAYRLCGACQFLAPAVGPCACPACGHDGLQSLRCEDTVARLQDDLDTALGHVPARAQWLGTVVGSWSALGVVAASIALDAVMWSSIPAAGAILAAGFALPPRVAASRAGAWTDGVPTRWRAPLRTAMATVPSGEWTGPLRVTSALVAPLSRHPVAAYRLRASLRDPQTGRETLVLDESGSASTEFGRFTLPADALQTEVHPRSPGARVVLGDGDDGTGTAHARRMLERRGFRTAGSSWILEESVIPPNAWVALTADDARCRAHVVGA